MLYMIWFYNKVSVRQVCSCTLTPRINCIYCVKYDFMIAGRT